MRDGLQERAGYSGPAALADYTREDRVVDGLLIPKSFSFTPIFRSSRSKLFFSLLSQPDASPLDLDTAIADGDSVTILPAVAGG